LEIQLPFQRVCRTNPQNPGTGEGAKRINPPPGSLQAVGWKLGLACCQFLPSPEAPVVLIIVVDVVVERDDIDSKDREAVDMGLIEMARDNITRIKNSTRRSGVQCKIPLRHSDLLNESCPPAKGFR
jgi:hypothetical protein